MILFTWNDYKAQDEVRAHCADCVRIKTARDVAIARDDDQSWRAYEHPRTCELPTGTHTDTTKDVYTYPNGKPKIWAIVRSVALHQCGHFMMGRARIQGTRLSISGSCGADGLPTDLQAVPARYRDQLVLVPEDVAAVYWKDDGHNTIGSAAPTMRDWAMRAFEVK